jgi:pyridoxamine 5'-phosphate oxidase
MALGDLRREYAGEPLDERVLSRDPIEQFRRWMEQAVASGALEPTAATLATAGRDGDPRARIVLLKGFDERGFVFFTNYQSAKGADLAENPRAALVFYWAALHRQVIVRGSVTRVTPEESDEYFATRPRGSQIGAWASPQSQVIADRALLETRVRELNQQFEDRPVPRPTYWGGYRLAPEVIEFWQGRADRLHDRFRYSLLSDDTWVIERLAP